MKENARSQTQGLRNSLTSGLSAFGFSLKRCSNFSLSRVMSFIPFQIVRRLGPAGGAAAVGAVRLVGAEGLETAGGGVVTLTGFQKMALRRRFIPPPGDDDPEGGGGAPGGGGGPGGGGAPGGGGGAPGGGGGGGGGAPPGSGGGGGGPPPGGGGTPPGVTGGVGGLARTSSSSDNLRSVKS